VVASVFQPPSSRNHIRIFVNRCKQDRIVAFLHDRVKDDCAYESTFTFELELGPVAAHRHLNPDGRLGGYVANTAYVDPTSWVSPKGLVYNNAQVLGMSRVYSIVKGDTIVKDKDVL